MSSNDRIILDRTLADRRREIAPEIEPSAFFELFVAEEVLKDFDLSSVEIESGHVAGTRDGGADGIYLFANGELVQEDTDLTSLKRSVEIELVIIQAKEETGFGEAPLDKLTALSSDLLGLDADLDALASTYNPEVLAAFRRFSATYKALAARFPTLTISYYYATKGQTPPHANAERKLDRLRETVKGHFSNAEFKFVWVGAAELLELARRSPRATHELRLSENPILSTEAFVCLVKLKEFVTFITDDQGKPLRSLFEANVRDYQGRNEVNEGIQGSLRARGRKEEFWWLNNGVTILASKATLSSKSLTIEDPQIVNGLQTSSEIVAYFECGNTLNEDRSLLVRVIVPSAPDIRDRIIKATNSQTVVPVSSLRATEKIHRDIEEYLGPHNLYYDRRKNFYKNAGKPWESIVSIPQMAQAVMAIVLQRPDSARARPSSLLKSDDDYGTVFNQTYPIELYLLCPQVMRLVEYMLRELKLDQRDRINMRFHVGMVAVALVAGVASPNAAQIAGLRLADFTQSIIGDALKMVMVRFQARGSTDQASKGSELLAELKADLVARLHKSKPAPAPDIAHGPA